LPPRARCAQRLAPGARHAARRRRRRRGDRRREGAQWLTATHPDKVRCDYLVNEGGGGILEYGERRLYCLGCAEKGVFRFALHTDGVAAHASMPRLGDNALLKLAPLLERSPSASRPTT
jgi:acetylornithine deacetylase/succinyl-diaminopimelate desuccinylase-like protein